MRSILKGAALQVEVAHASIGVSDEHFLHYRRRDRNNLSCRLSGSARLNEQFDSTRSAYSAS
jgi:hypothetical protein